MDNIIVCVKQVPNTANVKLDSLNHTIIREGVDGILNPFDLFALGAALRIKNKFKIKIGAVTMGPPQSESILKECIDYGVDEAFLITDPRLAGSDTLATARTLAGFIQKSDYKTVFCGQESIDSTTGHIGPSIAEFLNIPDVTNIFDIISLKDDSIKVKSLFEIGFKIIEVSLPLVLTFSKDNIKLLPKKPAKKRYLKYESIIKKININDVKIEEALVGLEGSPTSVVSIKTDENAANYFIVDSNLSSVERIKFILSGGIKENKNRIILKNNDQDISKLIDFIKAL